jgi:hypothetical protein
MSQIEKSIGIGEAEYLAAIRRAEKAEASVAWRDDSITRKQALIDETSKRHVEAERRADQAESELFALGIQHEALKARMKLAEACVDEAKSLMVQIHERSGPAYRDGIVATMGIDGLNHLDSMRRALAAFDAVPGDVGGEVTDAIQYDPSELIENTRPRYASGEVPMVGDVFEYEGTEVTIHSIGTDCVFDAKGLDWGVDDGCTLVRRAAPPAVTTMRAGEPSRTVTASWPMTEAERCVTTNLVCRVYADNVNGDVGQPDPILARAVALLREHAYDVRVIDFLADFDKGGV